MLITALTLLTILALAVIAAYASPTPVRARDGLATEYGDPAPAQYREQVRAVEMDDVLRGFGADL